MRSGRAVRPRSGRGQLGRALLGAAPARSGRGRRAPGPAGGGTGEVWRGAARAKSSRGRHRQGLDRRRRATSGVDIAGDEVVPPARARGTFFLFVFYFFLLCANIGGLCVGRR
jgi:hypothetical protein